MLDTANEQHSPSSFEGLFAPLALPCGRTVPNRLVKVHLLNIALLAPATSY
jgi:hypothetical protein